MRVVFLSNYFNHHQKSISDELYKQTNGKYSFIPTGQMSEERRKLGYGGYDTPPYLNEFNQAEITNSDIVIIGAAPNYTVSERISQNKTVFRYAERPFKKRLKIWRYPYYFRTWRKQNPKNKPIYMLCSSAFTAGDYAKFGLFKNMAYKWGYFPELKRYETDNLLENKKTNEILWCGRFLDWKHPDDVIKAAKKLKSDGLDFHITMIGIGEMEQTVRRLIADYGLDEYVELTGSMKPEQVRGFMERAGIYLFTSDRQEGWGAVLNESMNSGCAVVASHEIGSVPYLLEHNSNGLVYCSGNVDGLYERIKHLLNNSSEQKRLGKNAYHTISDLWNAEVAAERFVNLCEHILNGEKSPELYQTGPCSKAKIIKDDWFKVSE